MSVEPSINNLGAVQLPLCDRYGLECRADRLDQHLELSFSTMSRSVFMCWLYCTYIERPRYGCMSRPLTLLSLIAPRCGDRPFSELTPEPLNSWPAAIDSIDRIERQFGRNPFALEAYRQSMSFVSVA